MDTCHECIDIVEKLNQEFDRLQEKYNNALELLKFQNIELYYIQELISPSIGFDDKTDEYTVSFFIYEDIYNEKGWTFEEIEFVIREYFNTKYSNSVFIRLEIIDLEDGTDFLKYKFIYHTLIETVENYIDSSKTFMRLYNT